MGKKRCINRFLIENLVDRIKNKRDRLILQIYYETACKTNELINIRLSDVKKGFIQIKERKPTITLELFNKIETFARDERLENTDYIFNGRQSLQITTKRARQIVQGYSKKFFGEKINPEEIRKASIKEKLSEKAVAKVKDEVGLKRLDKRKFLSANKIRILQKCIHDRRTELVFLLLLNGLKSFRLTDLKVRDIDKLRIDKRIKEKLADYSKNSRLADRDPVFLTRQKSSLTKERIFQIITEIGRKSGVEVNPRALNNTAVANIISNESKLNEVGIKTRSFHLHGGFIENE